MTKIASRLGRALMLKACPGCNKVGKKMNKEHFFPEWLIERSGVDRTGIEWIGNKKISARAGTIPLCVDCNTLFGKHLESQVSRIFLDLESGKGLSDSEAELLVRWLWKFEGLYWILAHPGLSYTPKYSLAERILRPIDEIRGSLVLAIGLIDRIDSTYGDKPMGIDSVNEHNAIFVAGVFLSVAIMVLHEGFSDLVPPEFSLYHLANKGDPQAGAKLFYPKVGFKDCTEAVVKTKLIARVLSAQHDAIWKKYLRATAGRQKA
jgi:uncharacterized membrane protein